jgi:hypothetical protein
MLALVDLVDLLHKSWRSIVRIHSSPIFPMCPPAAQVLPIIPKNFKFFVFNGLRHKLAEAW